MVKKGVILASLLGFSVLGAATLATVTFSGKKGGKSEVVDITESDFDVLKQRNPNFNFNNLQEKQKMVLLDQAISNLLIEREAKKENLEDSPEFKNSLASYKKQLLVEVWVKHRAEAIGKEQIPEDQLKQYYDTNKDKFVQQEAQARHILVKTEADARRIISELNKVPKTKVEKEFIKIANRDSIDPNTKNTKNGGDLGKFQKSQMTPEFSKAVFELRPGTYTKTPVKTEFGYHVIYLMHKSQPITPTFEQAKQSIIGILKEQQFQEYVKGELEKLRKQVVVDIKPFPKSKS
ncbi:peptidylprolyl isomerase [Helicobacter cynogastricus]|uniref:peptidylprolyl isomerase n=1 Tax=Helicobacter cynogastricus TaxID=329937 RepID=UPI000CF0C263|nr:peptidylprolyl isomerase [Helicobacter cynogastricus]